MFYLAVAIFLYIFGCFGSLQSDVLNPTIKVADYCSGTFIEDPIDDGLNRPTILTAKHCGGRDKDRVYFGDETWVEINKSIYIFKAIKVSDASDLVLFQSDEDIPEPIHPANIFRGELYPGQEAWTAGYPMIKYGKLVNHGFIGEEVNLEPYGLSTSHMFQIASPDTMKGSSGSGLFVRTSTGYALCGVLSGGHGEFIGFWTPLSEVRAFLA